MPKVKTITTNELELINVKITLTIEEAAIYAGISADKIRQLVHTKDFPCFKNGNKWLINKQMLQEWIAKVSVEHREI
ncbi:helix-turn-helix domain-containing protein [Clostridium sp. UBA1652]|uniref:helix-turn-helix domain-containing protein n=1 Tax=Clostridium sp. UBA1652 TaxID=1946348 RepID=UPI00257977C5|nr:helix-turn-helix domain-containing protein [Clostridium sp. UBA1652]